ncbi:MAG: SRPBCC family protein [Pseudobdellovibrio sp.]
MENSKENLSSPQTSKQQNLTSPPPIEIRRQFAVSVKKLFQAFTSAEALKAWWWPKDLYADKVNLDFKIGGRYFINMQGSTKGGGAGMTGQFTEIIENRRIVMTDQFANEQGQAITAKEANMAGDWPATATIILEFDDLENDRSQLHLIQNGIPFDVQEDCVKGWEQSFDKLDKYLTKAH